MAATAESSARENGPFTEVNTIFIKIQMYFYQNTTPKKESSGKWLCLSILAIFVVAWLMWGASREAELVDYRMGVRERSLVTPRGTPETFGTTGKPGPLDIPASELRLPTTVFPINYDLTIKTYLPGYGYEADQKNLTFEGHIDIKVAITDKIKVITMNTMELEYVKSEFYVEGKKIGVDKVIVRESHELVDFHLAEAVGPTKEAILKVCYQWNQTLITQRISGHFLRKAAN